jgi:hypothetical protein
MADLGKRDPDAAEQLAIDIDDAKKKKKIERTPATRF